jgi:riboflavin-specific deaminase-like protein
MVASPDIVPETLPRPRVTLHFAQSLDGRIATRTGAAQWISGPAATRFAHELRAASGAVIIGSGTALADDPLLTVRHVDGPQPLRVVLDARDRLPAGARLLVDRTSPTIQATCVAGRAPAALHAERWVLPPGAGGEGIDLAALLARLAQRGARSVLVEGGRRVITSFLRARLVDRIVVSIAPIVVGAGIDAVGDLGTERLDQALRFTTQRISRMGDDVVVEMIPR